MNNIDTTAATSTLAGAPTRSRGRRLAWGLLTLLATLLALSSLHYLRPGMPSGFVEQLSVYREHSFWFLLHVVGGAIALLLGPWQFLPGLRARRPALHRMMGWGYVLGVLLGAIGGLYMARLAFGGIGVQVSFALLAVVWTVITATALARALKRDITAHRRWMARSYALSVAAVSQRLWLLLLVPAIGFTPAYQAAAWLGWMPNLLLVEWWLRRRERAR